MIDIKYILSEYNLKAITLILPIWLEKLHFLLSLQPSPSLLQGLLYGNCITRPQTLSLLGGDIARSWTDSIEQMQNTWQGL